MLPLTDITVLEFSQYLAGPSAGLRLADFGARVIKVERPGSGDACRGLAIRDQWIDDSSLLFHTINRNKESFAANLKDPDDLETVKKLIGRADVLTHNFRPGVMEKIGLDYEQVKDLNPRLIYVPHHRRDDGNGQSMGTRRRGRVRRIRAPDGAGR